MEGLPKRAYNKSRPVIGMDLDGVGYNWVSIANYLLSEHWDYTDLKYPHPTWEYLKQTVSKEAWKWLWEEGVHLGMYRHGHMYRGFKDGMDWLSERYDIKIVTSRPKSATVDTLDWLAFHKISAQEVHIVEAMGDKTQVPCHLYVDDGPKNIQDFRAASKPYIIWDQPWNKQEVGPRTSSFGDIPIIFARLAEARR